MVEMVTNEAGKKEGGADGRKLTGSGYWVRVRVEAARLLLRAVTLGSPSPRRCFVSVQRFCPRPSQTRLLRPPGGACKGRAGRKLAISLRVR